MYYFKQNLKLKDIEEYSKSLYLVFKTSKSFYNEMIHSSKKDGVTARYDVNSDVVKNSINSKRLGSFLTKTITGNFNINMSNHRKNKAKDDSYNLPGFRTKDSSFFLAFFGNNFKITDDGFVELKLNKKTIKFKVSKKFFDKKNKIKMVRLHKENKDYYLVYEYNLQQKPCLQYTKYIIQGETSLKAGLDLGVDALITVYSEEGNPLIISGKYLKFLNYKYSFKIKNAGTDKDLINKLQIERINKEKAVFNFACKRLFDYLIYNNIKTVYIGDFQGVKLKGVSKNFFMISYYLLKRKMKDYAKKNNINLFFIEESYTSKTSFYDREEPKFLNTYKGLRINRGRFKTENGKCLHADINGAAQILSKKHNVEDRSNVFNKPFFIDLVIKRKKIISKIKDSLRTIYKTEKKVLKVLSKVVDPEFFDYKFSSDFDVKNQRVIYNRLYYCKKTKRVINENEEKYKEFQKNS